VTGESPDGTLQATYDIDGPPDGPPIVFVHGTRLSRSMWRAQMHALRDTYRVIAVDLPGHGRLADVPFTLAGASDQVARVIDAAAGGRAVVVGLSLGGYVAMDLAARRPEQVRGLVLSGATTEPVGPLAAPYLGLAWIMERFDGPVLEAVNRWFFRTRFPAEIADPIIAGGFWSAGGARALRAIVGQRFAPRLAAYPGPSLILNGQLDPLFRLTVRRFARVAHDQRRVRLGGATHLANLDRPGAFNLAIRRFVEGLQGPDEALAGGPIGGPVLDLADPSRFP
jgi:pimeloyl-ACP methyl ester carboxylesterase